MKDVRQIAIAEAQRCRKLAQEFRRHAEALEKEAEGLKRPEFFYQKGGPRLH